MPRGFDKHDLKKGIVLDLSFEEGLSSFPRYLDLSSTHKPIISTRTLTCVDFIMGNERSPFLWAMPVIIDSTNGWIWGGNKYSNPATLPSNIVRSLAFSSTNNDVACMQTSSSPYICAYPWNPGVGFGVKYAAPATPPSSGTSIRASCQGIAFSGTADLACIHSSSPYASAWPWTPGVGFGVKYANPATLPTGEGRGIAFNGNTDVALGNAGSAPYCTAYPWTTGIGFGVKYANPGTQMAGSGYACEFNPGGAYVGFGCGASPFIYAYAWTAGVGFGAKVANPATLPPQAVVNCLHWTPSGNAVLGQTMASSNSHVLYPWAGAFGARSIGGSTAYGGDFCSESIFVAPIGYGPKAIFQNAGVLASYSVGAPPWGYSDTYPKFGGTAGRATPYSKTFNSTVAKLASGISAWYFDGTSASYLEIPAASCTDLAFQTNQSFLCWVYFIDLNVGSSVGRTLLGKVSPTLGAWDSGWMLSAYSNFVFYWYNGATVYSASSVVAPVAGVWTLLGITKPAGANPVKIYVNGVIANTSSSIGSAADTVATPLTIGWQGGIKNSGIPYEFYGYLSKIRFWSRVLSPAEMMEAFNSERDLFGV